LLTNLIRVTGDSCIMENPTVYQLVSTIFKSWTTSEKIQRKFHFQDLEIEED